MHWYENYGSGLASASHYSCPWEQHRLNWIVSIPAGPESLAGPTLLPSLTLMASPSGVWAGRRLLHLLLPGGALGNEGKREDGAASAWPSRWNRHSPLSELPLPKVGRAPALGTSLSLLCAQALSASWGESRSEGRTGREGRRSLLQEIRMRLLTKCATRNVLDVLAQHRVVYTSQGAFGM